jgi:hypothetical protein
MFGGRKNVNQVYVGKNINQVDARKNVSISDES